jgi:hypothetical protein
MKILRELLESLVKSGAWGSLEESSAKMFRQAGMHQSGMEETNKLLRLAQGIRDDAHIRRKKAAAARQNKEERLKQAAADAKKAEEHAKRYEEQLNLLKNLEHGQIIDVVLRGKPNEQHRIVRHQGSFHLVGPRGNSRQISDNFGSVRGGAINILSVPKGKGNAKTIGQIEIGPKNAITPRPNLKYTASDGKIKIVNKDLVL